MALLYYKPSIRPYFNLLHKDEDLLVFDKASGLLSVPGKALEHRDSLQLRVQRVWPEARIIHRLDMATSGLILMALNKEAQRKISSQFEKREVKKTYYAKVYGSLSEPCGLIDLPLICDWPNRPKQMVDHERGKPSQTYYECLNHDGKTSLVKLTPMTGRSHQLRVHMLSIGHPILGDRLYAHDQAKALSERLCLHASMIEFTHPSSQKTLSFSSPVPF